MLGRPRLAAQVGAVPPEPGNAVHASWPAGGLGGGTVDDRLTGLVDIAPTLLAAAGLPPDNPLDGHSLLDPRGERDHLLTEWWWNRQDKVPIRSWASYIGKHEQYTEYHRTRLDRAGRPQGTGEVLFREYHDPRTDPYQLTNLLHGASTQEERRLGVPEPARRLTAARKA